MKIDRSQFWLHRTGQYEYVEDDFTTKGAWLYIYGRLDPRDHGIEEEAFKWTAFPTALCLLLCTKETDDNVTVNDESIR
jgi:hypothetical protein